MAALRPSGVGELRLDRRGGCSGCERCAVGPEPRKTSSCLAGARRIRDAPAVALSREVLSNEDLYPEARTAISGFHPDVLSTIRSGLLNNAVMVIGMARNPFCKKARLLLTREQIEHYYWDCGGYFSEWKKRLAIKMWSGWPTFPQVFVKGKLVGGFSELEKAQQNGDLKRWLEQSG